jgi:magnesium transporter
MTRTLSDDARTLTYRPEDRMRLFRSFSVPQQSAAFVELSPYIQHSILKDLSAEEITDMLDNMDMRHAEQVLARIPSHTLRRRIVKQLKGEVREKTDFFLRFHPQASLSLVNFNYLFLPHTLTIGEAATIIDEHYDETGKYPEILVYERGELLGEVPFASLVRERNTNQLGKYVQPIPTISYQAEIPRVIEAITAARSKKIAILDSDHSVLGLIYSDAVRPLFGSLTGTSLYDFAGVTETEQPFDSVRKKVLSRYRWLILNLATCFLAGSVVLVFQDTIDTITILSVYIPIIAGMGGNAAAQSFAIMVRGLTLGIITLKTAWPAIKREVAAGFVNGVIIGTIVAFISSIWNKSLMLGVSVGIALVCAHMLAPLAGSLVPLLMKKFGKDPASTSSIFITTFTDVGGLLLLLGLATLILI